MFDGASEQLHQLVTPRTTLPLHLPFPLHASTTSNGFLSFDPYNSPHHQLPLQTNLLHPLPHHSPTHKEDEKEAIVNISVSSINVEIEGNQRQLPEFTDSWTNEEVFALLRIRSSMENWFPDVTWEHVSRKLAEVGFKKSAEKCKEKFEDESRYFNNINCGKNYRFLSELEELYQGDQNPDPGYRVITEKTTQKLEKTVGQNMMDHTMEENSRDIDTEVVTKQCDGNDKLVEKSKEKKRKRKKRDRFEMFKGFCENIVNQMMAQQEEIHNKLLKDMMERDEEKLAREEAWKKQEMERMDKELEMMTQEQANAGDRHATIIEFLKKYVAKNSPASKNFKGGNPKNKKNSSNRNSSLLHSQNPNPSSGENDLEQTPSNIILDRQTTSCTSPCKNNSALLIKLGAENPSSSDTLLQVPSSSNSSPATQNNPSSSLNSHDNPLESNSVSTYKVTSTVKDDVGRRWPRDEVLALINLRCTSLNSNNDDKEGNKVPLWERISQGMSELGYKRSAKRCKEKWENINKYFRKTKDVNKKRSLDSRTCPYFHQLSCLYNEGKIVPQCERPENHLNSTENSGEVPQDQAQAESSQVGSGDLIQNAC